MSIIILLIVVWIGLSFPVALLIGRFLTLSHREQLVDIGAHAVAQPLANSMPLSEPPQMLVPESI